MSEFERASYTVTADDVRALPDWVCGLWLESFADWPAEKVASWLNDKLRMQRERAKESRDRQMRWARAEVKKHDNPSAYDYRDESCIHRAADHVRLAGQSAPLTKAQTAEAADILARAAALLVSKKEAA